MPSKTNFLFAKHCGDLGGKELYLKLKDEGILVRHFDKERINDYKESIVNSKEIIERLEKRIVKANLEIYDKIDKEINQHNENIVFLEEEIDNYQYYYNKFYFLNGILEGNSTFDNYELIYTKC